MKCCPLLNHLISRIYLPVSVRKITDCSDWVSKGLKKDGTFVANEMKEVILELDSEKKLVDVCIMDGASVCKLAQSILKTEFPRMTCFTGADHTGHNIFKRWCELDWVKNIILQDKVSQSCICFLHLSCVTSNYSCY